MNILKRVEREVDEKLRKMFSPEKVEGEKREFLEVYNAILEEVAGHVKRMPRGRKVFPYNRIGIAVPAELKPLFEQVPLLADIQRMVANAGADAPGDLQVEITAADSPSEKGFSLSLQAVEQKPVAAKAPTFTLTIVHGKAEQASYQLTRQRVNVGRLAEVLDDQQRLTRRNDVCFPEGADATNATVSRAHAHIRFDAESGELRIYDDQSAYGTSLFRDGEVLKIPSGPGRGVALRDNDEIHCGQARVLFSLLNV